jgi:hypothetical protein
LVEAARRGSAGRAITDRRLLLEHFEEGRGLMIIKGAMRWVDGAPLKLPEEMEKKLERLEECKVGEK